MHTSNEIIIYAPYERIFKLGSRVEDWDRILPHYRYVRVLRRSGNRKVVRMSAWRDFIPVTWSAIEHIEEGRAEQPGRITFHHVKGLVRGMDVEWTFQARPDGGITVRISHALDNVPFPTSLLGARLTEQVVGKGFIGYIANKTLLTIKHLAESNA